MADPNGNLNGLSKTASEKAIVPDHLSMVPGSDGSAELGQAGAVSEDRIAELLAAYDDELANDCQVEISVPLDDLDPDSIARIEDLVAKARAVRRVQKALLVTRAAATDPTHVDHRTVNPATHDAPSPDIEVPEPAEFPKTLGRFEIVRELGSGGSGVVMLARDPVLGRFVALKIPRPETLFSKNLRRRFLRDPQAAARLTHPNLVPVYEVGEAGSVCYIAASFCDGPNLAEWLSRQSAAVGMTSAATLVSQLADGIDYAHGEGILHRDLKPANVLLEPLAVEGGTAKPDDLSQFRPRITDFGLAKLETNEAVQTRTGAVLGTLPYLAPEQADAKLGPVGSATDVYGLGVILYELLTGQRPFRGPSETETLRQLLGDEPAKLRTVRADVPRDLEAICLRCLEKNPRTRYATAAQLAADLRRFLAGEPTIARPLTSAQRLLNWTRRRPALASLLAVSTVGTLTLVALAAAHIVQLGTARQTAEVLRADAEASAESASRYMYASQMRSAYEWLDQGQINRAEKLVNEYSSGSRLAHLRGFEWYHLKRQLHGERLSLNTHHGEVYTVAFSPDGKILASGGQDGSIRFWNPMTGAELASVAGHRSCVNVVTYSRAGQILATASCDHTIKLWQASTHELLETLGDHTDEVHCLAFSPDGDKLVSGGHDGVARVWDVTTRKVVNRLDVKRWIDSLSWLNDGRAVVMGSERSHATLWNLDTNQHGEHSNEVHAIAVSPLTSEVFLPLRDGYFENWAPDFSSKNDGRLGEIIGFPRSIAFSPDGFHMASGGDQRVLRLWQRGDKPHARPLSGHAERIQAIAFHPQGDVIASGSFDGTVKLWDRLNSESIPRLRTHYFGNQASGGQSQFDDVAISTDLRYAAARQSATGLAVFKLADAAQIETIDVSPQIATGLNFLTADSPILFGIWQGDKHVMQWDVAEHNSAGSIPFDAVESLPARRAPIRLVLTADGRHVVSADATETTINVTVRDIHYGDIWLDLACKPPFPKDSSMIHFSPDGRTMDIAMGDEGNCIVDLDSRQQSRHDWPGILAIADHAKLIAYPYYYGTSLAIMQPGAGNEICALEHRASIMSAAFTPDSRTIATATDDGRVFLWNIATGELITQFDPKVAISKLQFSADGRKLAAIAFDSTEERDANGSIRIFVWEGSEEP